MERSSGRNSWRFFLLFFAIAICSCFGQYRFDHWTTTEGLPQSSVNDILQTRDSYLWLATSDGLVRFDGIAFTVFNRANSPGMISNRLTVLYQDEHDDLWIGADDAGVMRLHKGVFTGFGVENGLRSGWIRGISGDASDGLLVLVHEGVMSWRNGRFAMTSRGSVPDPTLVAGAGRYRSPKGYWTLNQNVLTKSLHGQARTWTREQGLPATKIQSVAEDEQGVTWVSATGKLFRDWNGRLVASPVPEGCSASGEIAFVSAPQLKVICRDAKDGLILSNAGSAQRVELPGSFLRTSDPLSNMIFLEDRSGILWIGVVGGGLTRVRRQAVSPLSEKEGLRGRNIYPIIQDHSGAVWMGAWPDTLNRFSGGKFKYFGEKDGLVPHICTLFEDRDARLWVGAYSTDGLRVFEQGRFVPPPGLRNAGVVRAIFQDRRGWLWFGSEKKLIRYGKDGVHAFTIRDGLATNYTNVFAEDAGGDLWIGGSGGLTRYGSGRFTAFTIRDGLPSATVRALYVDARNVLWIGTYDGGLARLEKGKFTCYGKRDGLFSDGVFQILEDSRGYLWMSSNQGIYRVKKQELNDFAAGKIRLINSIGYGRSDGMLTQECNGGHSPAGIRARDGKLWFPTQDGVAIIDPDNVPEDHEPPPVRIESLAANGLPISLNQPVQLSPTQRSLALEYTAMSFAAPERIRFRYKLDGFDQDWVVAGFRRTAYYSNVGHGSYVFRVIAANSDGVWNANGSSLALVILPFFYQTSWFRALVAGASAALIYFIWRLRVSTLERAFAAQRMFSHQLIASQEVERKRIASELHDSIGQRLAIIKNLADLPLKRLQNGDLGLQRLEEISSETRQAISDIREIAYNLRPYQLDRLGLTKTLAALLNKAAAASGIHFSVSLDNVDLLFPEHAEISFYRIVQESVNNILKHAGAAHVEVLIRRGPQKLTLRIHDDGKGFSPEPEQGGDPQAGGFGLRSISERAASLGCRRVTIDSAPGQGTTIVMECHFPGCKE